MTLADLEYFVCVVEEGNFTRAAVKKFVSRQAMSHAIHRLEADIGCTLLIQQDTELLTTEAGNYLYKKAVCILKETRQLRYDVQRISQHETPLQIAISNTILPDLYPELLRTLKSYEARHSGVIEDIFECDNQKVIEQILNGVDLGFLICETIEDERLDAVLLKSWPLYITFPKTNPLNTPKEISVRDLAGETIMMPGEPKLYFPTLYSECLAEGFTPEYTVISSAIEGTYAMEHSDIVSLDIPWDDYNTRLTQKRLTGSEAKLVIQMISRMDNMNTRLSRLKKYLGEHRE